MKEFWKKWKFLFLFVLKLICLALVFFLVTKWVLTPVRVTGNGMYPGLRDGDLVLIWRLDEPYSGDIVAYETKSGLRMGRVVATGGQVVQFGPEGGYLVDGYAPMEEIPYPTFGTDSGRAYPLTVSEGSVFVLNDYRSDTTDSREYGEVPASSVMGKVLFLFRRRGF